jgi:hypothetical protein
MRIACIDYLEAVVHEVPDAMRHLSNATGPAAPFEEPSRGSNALHWRTRLHRLLRHRHSVEFIN